MNNDVRQESASPQILVVDDTPANLKLLMDILTHHHYRVRPASSGRLALRSVAAEAPDLILLDVKMPDMDGYEVCQKLKSAEHSRGIPVIFVSALDEAADKVKGFNAGGVDYITKPFQSAEVLARVETHLTLRRLQEQLEAQNRQLQREIAERKQAEEELKRHEVHLEELIASRTADLKKINQELQEEIAERKRVEEALRESKQRLSAIIDFLPDATLAIDRNGKIIAWNRAIEEMTGIGAASILGKGDYEYSLPFYGTRRPILIDLVFRSDGEIESKYSFMVRREEDIISADADVVVKGVRRALLGTAGPLYDSRGNVAGAIESIRDITERKRAEEERVRLATAIEQAAEGIIITDVNWVIQYVNPAFEHMSGYTRTEIVDQHARILKSDGHARGFYRAIRATLARGEVWSGRLINKKKDGTFYEAEVTGSPVRDESGTIISYVSIHRDVTHEVRLERALRQAQKMEAIGTLAGGIAHDFNNILTAIMGYTEMALRRAPQTGLSQGYLEQVIESGYRAADLVRQILTYSRQTEQDRAPVQIAQTVKEVLRLLRSSLPTTIEIREEIAVNLKEALVLADPTQIHQVVMNLCTNAAHAMRTKGGILSVNLLEVVADAFFAPRYADLKPGPYVRLTVADTGHGMDAAVMERIFDPYFTTKEPGEGTGLGLAVVQGIVKGYGGAITVYSEPGLGTTFQVFLPRIQGEILPEAEVAEPLPTGNERVLFVDDEQVLVNLGKEMLESLGYRVTARTGSLDALETFRVQSDEFDLVVTDMTMPGLTGHELAKELMAIRPDIPIILCTGFSQLIDDKVARETGIREFVMKPYIMSDLAKTIRKVLEKGDVR